MIAAAQKASTSDPDARENLEPQLGDQCFFVLRMAPYQVAHLCPSSGILGQMAA